MACEHPTQPQALPAQDPCQSHASSKELSALSPSLSLSCHGGQEPSAAQAPVRSQPIFMQMESELGTREK